MTERRDADVKPSRFVVAPVEPTDVDGVRTVMVGTAIWGVAFLALLPFYGHLRDAGHAWWLWTCLVGFALGLLGYEWLRWRERRRHNEVEQGVSGT